MAEEATSNSELSTMEDLNSDVKNMTVIDGETFDVTPDQFGCVSLNSTKVEYSSVSEFSSRLQASVCLWQRQGVTGVWIKIITQHAALIPICTELGFDFHHAQPGYVMLKRWLPKEKPDTLPGYATQFLGCAGFVVNDKNQVLVIQERFHTKKRWKLPGGHADPGEDIAAAAKREVFEETGIEAEYVCIGCFRHMHDFRYGCSDFYFVCVMHALTTDINACDHEISDCQWMDIDEYLNHPTITAANRYFAERCLQCLKKGATQMKAEAVPSMTKSITTEVYSVDAPQSHTDASQDT